jgi:prepilin-type N-terminal cleavage/methylation domain-containing protein
MKDKMARKSPLYFSRQQSMTLIEVLVAMSILSILLTIIFGFFRQLTVLEETTKDQQSKNFQKYYAEFRLSYLFSRLVNEKDNSGRTFLFFSTPINQKEEFSDFNSLIFTYHNGVRLNPNFSGDVLARLYVNKKDQLCLVSWPIVKKDMLPPHSDMQKEILLEKVNSISFDFYAAPDRNVSRGTIPPSAPTPIKGSWQKEWPFAIRKIMPNLIKITLTLKNDSNPLIKESREEKKSLEERIFIFPLPKSEHFIYYPTS